jgi:predicted DNA-binding transcriptional regulator AlpA
MADESEKSMSESLIDTEELARRTNTAAITWAKRRMLGGAHTPPFLKIGRTVRYRWSDVEAWLANRERGSTSEAA